MARVLHLTNDQFDALFDIVKDAVDYIEGDLITTEDENGNEVLEDISDYEIYQVWQQMNSNKSEPKVIISDDNYGDKVDTLVGNMVASDDNEFTHDAEGC